LTAAAARAILHREGRRPGAANYRVTAFLSLYAQKHWGWSEAEADTFRARIWAGSNHPI